MQLVEPFWFGLFCPFRKSNNMGRRGLYSYMRRVDLATEQHLLTFIRVSCSQISSDSNQYQTTPHTLGMAFVSPFPMLRRQQHSLIARIAKASPTLHKLEDMEATRTSTSAENINLLPNILLSHFLLSKMIGPMEKIPKLGMAHNPLHRKLIGS